MCVSRHFFCVSWKFFFLCVCQTSRIPFNFFFLFRIPFLGGILFPPTTRSLFFSHVMLLQLVNIQIRAHLGKYCTKTSPPAAHAHRIVCTIRTTRKISRFLVVKRFFSKRGIIFSCFLERGSKKGEEDLVDLTQSSPSFFSGHLLLRLLSLFFFFE